MPVGFLKSTGLKMSFLKKIEAATEVENEVEKHLKKGLFGLFAAKKYIKAIITGLKTSAKGLEKEGSNSEKTLELASKLQEVLKQFGLDK